MQSIYYYNNLKMNFIKHSDKIKKKKLSNAYLVLILKLINNIIEWKNFSDVLRNVSMIFLNLEEMLQKQLYYIYYKILMIN